MTETRMRFTRADGTICCDGPASNLCDACKPKAAALLRTSAAPAPPDLLAEIRAARLRTAEAPTDRMAAFFHADHPVTPATGNTLRTASAPAPEAPSLIDAIRAAAAGAR